MDCSDPPDEVDQDETSSNKEILRLSSETWMDVGCIAALLIDSVIDGYKRRVIISQAEICRRTVNYPASAVSLVGYLDLKDYTCS